MKYMLEHKEQIAISGIGNTITSRISQSWRWKQVAMSDDSDILSKAIVGDRRDYRIVDLETLERVD